MNLTPWDVQSKQIHTTDGVAPTLYAAEKTWGGHSPIIFETHESSDIQENSSPSRQSGGARMGTNGQGRYAECV